ncbi:MAG TPA: hypothetical protein VNH44_16240 [Micropepsaceae bacterium]|nr:hypothetical protein [Micropepsaceae bacterium]
MEFVETHAERRARYKRLAIAAAAAAARNPVPGVRTAYLLLAESWSELADAEDPEDCALVVSQAREAVQMLEPSLNETPPEKH